jgi:hypothetical protein
MVGFITERDLEQAEEAFPGIARFFVSLSRKPRTFLELVCRFEDQAVGSSSTSPDPFNYAHVPRRHSPVSPSRGRRLHDAPVLLPQGMTNSAAAAPVIPSGA